MSPILYLNLRKDPKMHRNDPDKIAQAYVCIKNSEYPPPGGLISAFVFRYMNSKATRLDVSSFSIFGGLELWLRAMSPPVKLEQKTSWSLIANSTWTVPLGYCTTPSAAYLPCTQNAFAYFFLNQNMVQVLKISWWCIQKQF